MMVNNTLALYSNSQPIQKNNKNNNTTGNTLTNFNKLIKEKNKNLSNEEKIECFDEELENETTEEVNIINIFNNYTNDANIYPKIDLIENKDKILDNKVTEQKYNLENLKPTNLQIQSTNFNKNDNIDQQALHLNHNLINENTKQPIITKLQMSNSTMQINNELNINKQNTNINNKSYNIEQLNEKDNTSDEECDVEKPLIHYNIKTNKDEKVHIKVADGGTIDTQKQDYPKKMADKIIEFSDKENQVIQMQLKPESLGKVTVKIEFLNGNAVTEIICENAQAKEVLSKSSEQIKNIIQTNTNYNTSVEIKFEENMQKQQFNTDANGRNNQNPNKNKKDEKEDKENQIIIEKFKLDFLSSLNLQRY